MKPGEGEAIGGPTTLARAVAARVTAARYLAPALLTFLLVAVTSPVRAAGDTTLLLTVTTASGEVLVTTSLPPDATWSIEWRHSVAQVRIVDVFAWRAGLLYVTDQFTPYLDIAGLGNFDGRGKLEQLADGSYHLSDIDLALHGNAHDLIIGSERAPTVLVVGERRFELSETHPATHARIEVKQR